MKRATVRRFQIGADRGDWLGKDEGGGAVADVPPVPFDKGVSTPILDPRHTFQALCYTWGSTAPDKIMVVALIKAHRAAT